MINKKCFAKTRYTSPFIFTVPTSFVTKQAGSGLVKGRDSTAQAAEAVC
jgi:hypothetical protein